MSLSSLITDLKAKLLGSDKPKPLAKIAPVFDTEYMPDLEAGEGEFYRRLKQRQSALELHTRNTNCDVEKADNSIICGEVAIDVNGYEKCKIIENYVSFMDVINYFSTPINERERQELPFSIRDSILPLPSEQLTSSHIAIDMTDEDFIDLPLHLCRSNIL
jgi:hypothetical protein